MILFIEKATKWSGDIASSKKIFQIDSTINKQVEQLSLKLMVSVMGSACPEVTPDQGNSTVTYEYLSLGYISQTQHIKKSIQKRRRNGIYTCRC